MAHANCLGLNHCEQRARQLVGDGARQEDLGKVLRDEYGRLAGCCQEATGRGVEKVHEVRHPGLEHQVFVLFLGRKISTQEPKAK